MSNPFNDRLVDLHHAAADLKVYDKETGCKLYQCSKIFGSLLVELLVVHPENFKDIAEGFETETEDNCRIACESNSEDERIDAFYNGVVKLNEDINQALEFFRDIE